MANEIKIKDLALISEVTPNCKIPVSDLVSGMANAVSIQQVTDYISAKVKESEVYLTQSEYDALADDDELDNDTTYYIYEE